MVSNKEPVANVQAVPIYRDGFAGQDALDNDGDEFFGELIRAVVIRAIRDDCRQALGVMVGPDEHVARCLARGVRRVRGVGCGLGEKTRRSEGAEDLVGAYMQKPRCWMLDAECWIKPV